MRLVLHVEGASAKDLARGVAAAQAVFDRAGVDPWDAALGAHAREGWDMADFDADANPGAEMMQAASVLDGATSAAIEACCAGWPEDFRRRCDLEVRPAEPTLAQQLREATKWWLDSATPSELWKVMQHGGLSASIPVVNGLPQVMVRDDGGAGLLATFGILRGDALADYARRWNAPPAAAGEAALLARFARDDTGRVGPWRYLDAQIKEGAELFEAIAQDWYRSHALSAVAENEDADPVGAPTPRARFAELAVQAGLIRPGDPLDQNVIDLCNAVVGACARIADRYGDGEAGGNAGEHIRDELLE